VPDFCIFISYCRTDRDIVGPLVSLLRIVEPRVFRDEDNIQPGSRWEAALVDAIEHCEMLLVFWCVHAAASTAVKAEYARAIALGKRVVPLRLDDTDLPRDLAQFQAIDLRMPGGHREGYVSVTREVLGMRAGQRTETVRERRLILPDAAVLHLGALALRNGIEELLDINWSRS